MLYVANQWTSLVSHHATPGIYTLIVPSWVTSPSEGHISCDLHPILSDGIWGIKRLGHWSTYSVTSLTPWYHDSTSSGHLKAAVHWVRVNALSAESSPKLTWMLWGFALTQRVGYGYALSPLTRWGRAESARNSIALMLNSAIRRLGAISRAPSGRRPLETVTLCI